MVAISIQFSFYCWELYFNQFLQVVYLMSISNAGYMLQIYNVGSCFWGVVFGLWVRYSRRVKYEALCFGLPLAFLGAGLTIYFRGQNGGNDVGYIVMVSERRIQPSIVSRSSLKLRTSVLVAEGAVRNLKLDHEPV